MPNLQIDCEWGESGITANLSLFEVVIIVDVLSFSTCVDIALHNGAFVYPYQFKGNLAIEYARQHNALLAKPRQQHELSLSPRSLQSLKPKDKLVLPSPNGATLTLICNNTPTFTGCLRNAAAVAIAAKKLGNKILIIAAGERWKNNEMRVAFEDIIGAGSIIAHLSGVKSEEAKYAETLFNLSKKNEFKDIYNLKSGIELISIGFKHDIDEACRYNVSTIAPIYKKIRYEPF